MFMRELINRNRKVYTRDRVAFFMSFLSVIILILVYQIFLGELQIESIKAEMNTDSISIDAQHMVNNWLVAGLTTITSMTGTLGAFSTMIQDKEKKIYEDLRITPYSPFKIELSYSIFAILFGIVITFCACIFALFAFNGFSALYYLSFKEYLTILSVISLSTMLSAAIILPVLNIIRTSSSYSTLSTIIGTLIGFLSGVYISIGSVGKSIQLVMTWFPLTQVNSLLKQILMKHSMDTVFKNADEAVINSYKENYGVVLLTKSGNHLSNNSMIAYLFTIIIILILVNIIVRKVKLYGK